MTEPDSFRSLAIRAWRSEALQLMQRDAIDPGAGTAAPPEAGLQGAQTVW